MRVISGRFKGRRLVSFDADHIRPTTDRVKESLFNILMGEVEGAIVLDLFAGTGSLGIEALSRGAQTVTFVEKSKKSIQIIKKNLALLKVNEGFEIVCDDVFKFLKRPNQVKYDLILMDPPFTENWGDCLMQTLSQSSTYGTRGVVALETGVKEILADQYGDLKCVTQRTFGDKTLSLFRRRN